MKKFKKILLILFTFPFWGLGGLFAHPMPNSVVLLQIHEKNISGEIQLPLSELQSAIGMSVNDNSEDLVKRLDDTLRQYLIQHIRPKTFEGKPWTIALGDMNVSEVKNKLTGDYKELVVKFSMQPPPSYDLRNFYFDYDVILKEVASHKILVSVKQDWLQGQLADNKPIEVGVIALDVPSGKIFPFQISLQQGSTWKGFKAMVFLGMQHIKDGTDHLLFLLLLLLPAPLLVNKQRWGSFGGVKYSLFRLLKVVTAFTIGHSITLIISALGFKILSSQVVEIGVAVSILISAINVYRPIFYPKKYYIATGFGLIHGLAFANTLTELNLDTPKMILSILGFNIGIELMQLFLVLLVIPFVILLSRTKFYPFFRIIGAISASIIAIFWIYQRMDFTTNFL